MTWYLCWWLLVTYVVVSNANIIDSAVIVCPNDLDCVVNCSPLSRNCYNKRIVCPGSNSSLTYNCTIVCDGTVSCVGTTIESSHTVSILEVQALDSSACENVAIRANGTENILLLCQGNDACTHSNLTSSYGKSVVLIATQGSNQANTGFYTGMLNISYTPNVTLICDNWGCSDSHWMFYNVENLDLKCFNYSGCVSNSIEITKSINATIEGASGTYMMWQNQINISKVENLMVKVDGDPSGSFSLLNIENFLYIVENSANPLFAWVIQNVSNIALNSWNVTSFWLVDGMPIQKEYKCPNGRDCNIRVDANLSLAETSSVPVICPTDSEIGHTQPTTCRFYCGSLSGCAAVNLTVKEVTNVALYFSMNSQGLVPFSVYPSGLPNVNSTINITCGLMSCLYNTFNVSRYDYVNLIVTDTFAYSNAVVNVSEFYQVTAISMIQGFQNTTLTLTDGHYVNLMASPGTTNAFLGSNWLFNDIKHVAIACLNTLECEHARFDAMEVDELSIICGNPNNIKSTTSCWSTVVNLLQDASLNLTCAGGGEACLNMIIRYNESDSDETSLAIDCLTSTVYSTIPNCDNVTIEVLDNKRGFDAISFFCEVEDDNPACQDVTVSCGNGGIECHCPVKYDDDEDEWYCDGACGTSTCPASESSSKKTTYIIIAAASVGGLLTILVIVILVRKKCNKHSFQPLLDEPKHNYTH